MGKSSGGGAGIVLSEGRAREDVDEYVRGVVEACLTRSIVNQLVVVTRRVTVDAERDVGASSGVGRTSPTQTNRRLSHRHHRQVPHAARRTLSLIHI